MDENVLSLVYQNRSKINNALLIKSSEVAIHRHFFLVKRSGFSEIGNPVWIVFIESKRGDE